jgi:hypothetical protein
MPQLFHEHTKSAVKETNGGEHPAEQNKWIFSIQIGKIQMKRTQSKAKRNHKYIHIHYLPSKKLILKNYLSRGTIIFQLNNKYFFTSNTSIGVVPDS